MITVLPYVVIWLGTLWPYLLEILTLLLWLLTTDWMSRDLSSSAASRTSSSANAVSMRPSGGITRSVIASRLRLLTMGFFCHGNSNCNEKNWKSNSKKGEHEFVRNSKRILKLAFLLTYNQNIYYKILRIDTKEICIYLHNRHQNILRGFVLGFYQSCQ